MRRYLFAVASIPLKTHELLTLYIHTGPLSSLAHIGPGGCNRHLNVASVIQITESLKLLDHKLVFFRR